jgi:hypothetical protein
MEVLDTGSRRSRATNASEATSGTLREKYPAGLMLGKVMTWFGRVKSGASYLFFPNTTLLDCRPTIWRLLRKE